MTPEGWALRKLGDVATITSGGTPKVGRGDYYGGEIPFAKIEDVTSSPGLLISETKTHITRKAVNETAAKVYPPGTVLVTMYGTIGEAAVTAIPMAANQAIAAFLDLKGVDRWYLAYMLQTLAPHFRRRAGQTTQANISGAVLKNFECRFPPLPEQVAIATTLKAVDDAIAASDAVIEQLDRVRKDIIADLLHHGLPRHADVLRESEIGQVPAAWAIVPLGDLIEDGPTNGLYRPQDAYGEGVPIIRIDAFANGDVVDITQLRRLRITSSEAVPYRVGPGDIVINRVNSLSHLGKVGLVERVDETTVFESNMMRIRMNATRCVPRFAFLVLASPLARDQLLRRAKLAVAQASINQQDVKGVLVPLPPVDEQKVIVNAVGAVTDRLSKERAVIAERRRVKVALADALLTGRLRVRGAA